MYLSWPAMKRQEGKSSFWFAFLSRISQSPLAPQASVSSNNSQQLKPILKFSIRNHFRHDPKSSDLSILKDLTYPIITANKTDVITRLLCSEDRHKLMHFEIISHHRPSRILN